MNKLFFLFIIVLFIISINFTKYTPENFQNNKYTIICARYKKNTDFLEELSNNFEIKIIQKENVNYYNEKFVDCIVPNKAHEATSYLKYIIKYYDNLPDNNIFIHDENESWHHEGKISENISKWIKEYEKSTGYYEINKTSTDSGLSIIKTDEYKDFFNYLFPNNIDKVKYNGKCCAQFIVSKQKILNNTKEFYIKYYNWLINNTMGVGNGDKNNKYCGWFTSRYAEWTWKYIFNHAASVSYKSI